MAMNFSRRSDGRSTFEGLGTALHFAMNSFTSAYFKSCLKTRTGEKTFMPMGSILARAELPKARFHTISESLDDFSIDLVETKYIVLNGEATLPTRKGYFFQFTLPLSAI